MWGKWLACGQEERRYLPNFNMLLFMRMPLLYPTSGFILDLFWYWSFNRALGFLKRGSKIHVLIIKSASGFLTSFDQRMKSYL